MPRMSDDIRVSMLSTIRRCVGNMALTLVALIVSIMLMCECIESIIAPLIMPAWPAIPVMPVMAAAVSPGTDESPDCASSEG
jgi:hypothetical protein